MTAIFFTLIGMAAIAIMIFFFYKISSPSYKDDWYPIWAANYGRICPYGYQINHSPSRRKIELECKGYKAELMQEYSIAVEKFNELAKKYSNENIQGNTKITA